LFFSWRFFAKNYLIVRAAVGGREFCVYWYEGKLNDIMNAVIILSYPKEAFGKEKALRVFLFKNIGLAIQEILNMYISKWSVEVFFRQRKDKLTFDKYQIRS